MAVNIPPVDILIRAIDQTGPVLAEIEKRLRLLEQQAGKIGQGGGGSGGSGSGNSGGGQSSQQPQQNTKQAVEENKSLFSTLGNVAFAYNNITGAVRSLAAQARPAYDLLIGQNVTLQNQLLSTQATLAATNRVFANGVEINDPGKAIKSLEGPIKQAVAELRQGSLELVGVTSSDLIPVFQQIAGKSSQIGASLSQSKDLTLSFAAALGTLKIPMNQAGQEVNSILMGQIDQNSVLAKSLGITNQQVETYRAQGRLVEFLNGRLAAFREGNKLAAQTIDGVTSNIQELIEEFGRSVGEPLLDPLVSGLNEVYKVLADNKDEIIAFGRGFVSTALSATEGLRNSLEPVLKSLGPLIAELGPLAQQVFVLFTNGLQRIADKLGPILTTIIQITTKAAEGIRLLTELFMLNQINDASDAIDILAGSTQRLTDETIKTATALKGLANARKSGRQLTADELKQEKLLMQQSEALKNSLDQQIESYRQIPSVSPEIAAARDAEIKNLEKLKNGLDSAGGGIVLQTRQAEKLGNEYEQLARQADAARRIIAQDGQGDTEMLAGKSKELIGLLQQQLDLGAVTEEQALEEIRSIQQNERVKVEVRRQASDTITKIREASLKRETEELKAQQTEVEALLAQGGISEVDAAKKTTELKQEQLDKQLEATRQAIQDELLITGGKDSTKLQELRTREKQQAAEQAKAKVEGRKQIAEAEIKAIDAEQADLKAQQEAGLISSVEAEEKITELKLQSIEARLAAAVKGSSEEKKLLAELLSAQVAGRKAIAEAEIKAIQTGAEETKAAVADGLIGELEAEKQLTAAKVAELEKRINAASEGTNEQKKLISELAQFQDEADNKLSALKLQRFEAESKRALEIANAAERERQIQQQALINQGLLREEEANTARLESQRETTNEELKEAQRKVEFLRKLPRPDGEKETRERAELEINARKAVFDATVKLLEQQRQLQKAILADLDRELKRQTDTANNATRQQTLGLEKQLLVSDTFTKSLDAQNKLLQARQSLNSSFVDLATSQLDILAKGTESEEEKKKLAELTALIKFQALKAQNEAEKQSLDLQLQQEAAALRRQKIENDIAKIKNQADVLSRQAALVKAEADLKAGVITKEQRDAAELELQAAQQQGVALNIQDQQIGQQQAIFAQTASARVQQQQLKSFQSEQGAVAGLLEVGKDNAQLAPVREQFFRNLQQSLGLGQGASGISTALQTLLPQVVGAAAPAVSGGGVNALALASGALPVAALPGIVPGVSVAAAEQAQVQQQPLLDLGGKIATLQSTLVEALKPAPVVDAVKDLGSEIRTLAGTPRSLTIATTEKQSPSDVLQLQSRSLAVAAGL